MMTLLRPFFCLVVWLLLVSASWSAGSDSYQKISSSELKALMDKQEPGLVIIDSRTPQEFQEAHLRGAINLPLSVQELSPQRLAYAQDAKIVFYCNGFT
jgi:rhodanese-related sulfurtransferase